MRRRLRGNSYFTVQVPVDEVLEEADTRELLEEIKARAEHEDSGAIAFLRDRAQGEGDLDDIVYATRAGRAQELLAVMTRVLGGHPRLKGGVAYADLPRDVVSRRPLVL